MSLALDEYRRRAEGFCEQLSREYYLHLAPELSPSLEGSAFLVPLASGRQMRIESLSPDCTASEACGVKTKQQIQGWVTQEYLKMVPASALQPGKEI